MKCSNKLIKFLIKKAEIKYDFKFKQICKKCKVFNDNIKEYDISINFPNSTIALTNKSSNLNSKLEI